MLIFTRLLRLRFHGCRKSGGKVCPSYVSSSPTNKNNPLCHYFQGTGACCCMFMLTNSSSTTPRRVKICVKLLLQRWHAPRPLQEDLPPAALPPVRQAVIGAPPIRQAVIGAPPCPPGCDRRSPCLLGCDRRSLCLL